MPHARFQLTKADVVAAANVRRRFSILGSPLALTLGSAFEIAIYFVAFKGFIERGLHLWSTTEGLFGYIVSPLVVLSVFVVMRLSDWPSVVLQRFFASPMARAPLDIAWDASGIELDLEGQGWTQWRQLRRWGDGEGVMVLFFTGSNYLILPERAFGAGEQAMMRGYLEGAGVPEAGRGWWRSLFGSRRRATSQGSA